MLVEKKAKRGAMMYMEKHRQVKEVVTTDQVVRKDRLDDRKLDFRCLLGRTWARRVMLTTVQKTWNFGQGLFKSHWLLPIPTNPKPQAVSKEDISGKLRLRSCIQCQLILEHPGRNSMLLNNSIGSLKKSCRVDGYRDALAAVTESGMVRANRQSLSLTSDRITSWMLWSASSIHFFSKTAKDQKALGVPKKERVQYSYLSTCNHILDQLHTEDLDVLLMFRCTLKKRAAIDNELLD